MHPIGDGCWDPKGTIPSPTSKASLGRFDDQNPGFVLEQATNGIDTDSPGLGDLGDGVVDLERRWRRTVHFCGAFGHPASACQHSSKRTYTAGVSLKPIFQRSNPIFMHSLFGETLNETNRGAGNSPANPDVAPS
jgi:hypothetical protein